MAEGDTAKEAGAGKPKERGDKSRSTKKGTEKAKEAATLRRPSKRARPVKGYKGGQRAWDLKERGDFSTSYGCA